MKRKLSNPSVEVKDKKQKLPDKEMRDKVLGNNDLAFLIVSFAGDEGCVRLSQTNSANHKRFLYGIAGNASDGSRIVIPHAKTYWNKEMKAKKQRIKDLKENVEVLENQTKLYLLVIRNLEFNSQPSYKLRDPSPGDMVMESSSFGSAVWRCPEDPFLHMNQSIGRLIMHKKGCEACVRGFDHSHTNAEWDGEDAKNPDDPHHDIDDLWLIENANQTLIVWRNCRFRVVDRQIDDELDVVLHGNYLDPLSVTSLATWEDKEKASIEFAQADVLAALERHGVVDYLDRDVLVGPNLPPIT